MAEQHDWLNARVQYIRGLKNPSEQQRLMVTLATQADISAADRKKLTVLIRAEKAAERAVKARADVARVMGAERRAARKARDHELYKAAGLMGLAGVVDRDTGKPTIDAGTLVGMLKGCMSAYHNADKERVQTWKKQGDALIAAAMKKKKPEEKTEEGQKKP